MSSRNRRCLLQLQIKYAFTGRIGRTYLESALENNRDKEKNPIPGLFAAGCVTGGIVGDTYPLNTTGGSPGFAVINKRIAGEGKNVILK